MPESFQVIVVGAGHAGCEAALAAARLGKATALITINNDKVAQMSCNPAIGGLGKSQIVREIDALGGEMGRAADATAIHFRRLNASKGPAVRARRVQCDIGLYHKYMLEVIQQTKNLELIEGMVSRLVTDQGEVRGVELQDGRKFGAQAVVVTTGTFLQGKIFVGEDWYEAGRIGDPSAKELSSDLLHYGFDIARLKTGTPARLKTSSLNLAGLDVQQADQQWLPFSHEGKTQEMRDEDPGVVHCRFTRTNNKTHEIIRSALSRSPLFSGEIKGTGARYCPSIEDKVVRFPERESHQVILEPTDLTQEVIYPNGISTSLPKDIQERFIHSIEGLEKAEIIDYGYAIEYDFVLPTQLKHSLETRTIKNLFLAGQINGTSGYEEAAGQGLIAGINAVFKLDGKEEIVIPRSDAYIGVMIDDLVVRGTNEPYRMFSSRAEFRLLLREDNAYSRLDSFAKKMGLVEEDILSKRRQQLDEVSELVSILRNKMAPKDSAGRRPTLEKMLRRPEVGIKDLVEVLDVDYSQDILEQAEVEIKYKGYIERQIREARKLQDQENRKIPKDIDYKMIPGLSNELIGKLSSIRPTTFGQASRIDGMTPAALMVLSIWITKTSNVPRGTLT
jgi:tRNA uridine 5-carboxymethylaminomethyl modification enzyme